MTKFSSTFLTVLNRVLHYLITHTITPRGDNHDIVLNTDLFMIWAILHQERIYWPDTICQIMLAAHNHRTSPLPYPMLVQAIMELKCVPMIGEVKSKLKENHKFGCTQLKKAEIRQIAGVWTWDPLVAPPPHAPATDMMDEDMHPQADDPTAAAAIEVPPASSASQVYTMTNIMNAITMLQTTVADGF